MRSEELTKNSREFQQKEQTMVEKELNGKK